MSKLFSTYALIVVIMLRCGELQADTITQDSGLSTVTISFFDPIGQTFQWTADEFLGSLGFTFGTQNPSAPNLPITVILYAGAGFSGTVLGTVTQTLPLDLPGPTLPGVPIDFDFSGIAMLPGTYTAAVVADSARLGVKVATTNPYADGALVFTPGLTTPDFHMGLCTPTGSPCDLQFRVRPASVSDASSATLLAAGLLLFSAGFRSLKSARLG